MARRQPQQLPLCAAGPAASRSTRRPGIPAGSPATRSFGPTLNSSCGSCIARSRTRLAHWPRPPDRTWQTGPGLASQAQRRRRRNARTARSTLPTSTTITKTTQIGSSGGIARPLTKWSLLGEILPERPGGGGRLRSTSRPLGDLPAASVVPTTRRAGGPGDAGRRCQAPPGHPAAPDYPGTDDPTEDRRVGEHEQGQGPSRYPEGRKAGVPAAFVPSPAAGGSPSAPIMRHRRRKENNLMGRSFPRPSRAGRAGEPRARGDGWACRAPGLPGGESRGPPPRGPERP